MNWTKTKPTKPGHYWTSHSTDADHRNMNMTAHVVEVYKYDERLLFASLEPDDGGPHNNSVDDRTWWSGPIELPDPPGYQPSGWPAFK